MLPLARFLNLVYYFVVSRVHKEEERKRFERALERPKTAEERDSGRPSWWRGEREASQSALAAARAMGVPVDALLARQRAAAVGGG